MDRGASLLSSPSLSLPRTFPAPGGARVTAHRWFGVRRLALGSCPRRGLGRVRWCHETSAFEWAEGFSSSSGRSEDAGRLTEVEAFLDDDPSPDGEGRGQLGLGG